MNIAANSERTILRDSVHAGCRYSLPPRRMVNHSADLATPEPAGSH